VILQAALIPLDLGGHGVESFIDLYHKPANCFLLSPKRLGANMAYFGFF
tara:strand:+ start:373 stop:519 length:147 start_codon:yes stop_codon:yes gene_type:complete